MSFEDNVLLKIKRDYNKDEVVKFLIEQNDQLQKKIKDKGILTGQLKSEVAYLEARLQSLNAKNPQLKNGWTKDLRQKFLDETLQKQFEKFRANSIKWKKKYYELKNKSPKSF